MTSPKSARDYYPVIEGIVDQAVQHMPQHSNKMDKYLSYVSTDLFNTLLLGRPLNLTNNEAKPADLDYVEAITKRLRDIMVDLFTDPEELQLFNDGDRYKESVKYKEMCVLLEDVLKHGEGLLSNAIDRLADGDEATVNSYIGHRLARMTEDNLTHANLVENIALFLMAAVDTTANVLSVVLYNLASNPAAQQTLRDQVFEVLGSNAPLGRNDLRSIPYWRCFLKETYRLTPSVNVSMRTLPEDIELNGYHIPSGTALTLSSIPYLWSPSVFPEPMKFDPSRWDKSKKEKGSLAHHPYMITPFSMGKRMCPAFRVAEVEISATICRLLQLYRISLTPDSPVLSDGRTHIPLERTAAKFIFEPLSN